MSVKQKPDPRLNPWRDDLAAAHLRGEVDAPKFVEGTVKQVTAPVAALRRSPADGAMQDSQLAVLHGAISRAAPQSGNRRGHLFDRALDKFRGVHFTAQMRRRQIIAPGIEARIGLLLNRQSALPNNDKRREWLAPRRRPDDRRVLSNSMHKYRNAPNRGNYRQSAQEIRRR